MRLSSALGALVLTTACESEKLEIRPQGPEGNWSCYATSDLSGEDDCVTWREASVPVAYAPSESVDFSDQIALTQLRSAVVEWNLKLVELGLDFRFEAPHLTDESCGDLLELSLNGDLDPQQHRVTACVPRLDDWEYFFTEDEDRVGNTVVNFDHFLGTLELASPAVFFKSSYPDVSTTGTLLNPDEIHELFKHELGHTLGLGHSELRSALMYTNYNPSNASGAISPIEEDALLDLYGED